MLRGAPYLALLTFVLLFYRKVLLDSHFLIPWDLATYHLPLMTYISRCFRNGEFPWWDPFPYCGFPFHANMQAALFYPPTWLTIWLSDFATTRALLDAFEWSVAGHVFLGGAGAFLLLRRLGARPVAATLGGIVFQGGAFFATLASYGATAAGAWMPLAWLGVVALREKFRWSRLALLALPLSMAVLAGFPAVTAVVWGSTLLLACGFAVADRSGWRLPALVVAAAMWAAMLAGVQLAPSIELYHLSVARDRAADHQLSRIPLVALQTLVFPNRFGELDMKCSLPLNPAFVYFFCGTPALLLAIVAAAFRRDRLCAVFGGLAAASLLWTLGASTPVGVLVDRLLPRFVQAAIYPEFTKGAFVLGLAVLAGLGLDALVLPENQRWAVTLVAVAAAELALIAGGRPLNTQPAKDFVIATGDSFEGSADTLAGVRKLVEDMSPPWRVEAFEDSPQWATAAMAVQVPTPHGNDPFALSRVLAVRRIFCSAEPWLRYCPVSDLQSPLLNLLNVRYIVVWAPDAPPYPWEPLLKSGFRLAAHLPGHKVFENSGALPRFYLVGRIESSRSLEETVARMKGHGFDPGGIAIVEGVPPWEAGDRPPPSQSVTVLRYAQREVRLKVKTPAPAFLVTSETHYPGWRAWVDSRERPIRMTNGAFRGLEIPSGEHEVTMRYRPIAFWYGLAVSVGALIGVLMALLPVEEREDIPWVGRVRYIRWFYWRWIFFLHWLRIWRHRLLGPPPPGSRAYARHMAEERKHFADLHDSAAPGGNLMEPAPPVWEEALRRADERVARITGKGMIEHVVSRLRLRADARFLSLGSGPGGLEILIAQECPEASYVCLDVNPAVLALGERRARELGLRMEFREADLNTVWLEPGAYDMIFCHAALHHLIALEHIFSEIRRALRPEGVFIVCDIITRNGYRMWPETRKMMQAIWKTLPELYRRNHAAGRRGRVEERVWEPDTRSGGMECIRSEEILGLLRAQFREVCFVPQMALARYFFDSSFGPNYDLTRPLDRAVFEWIWALDEYCLDQGKLRPTSFFGIYAANS